MKIPTLGPGNTLIVAEEPGPGRQISRWLMRAGHRVEVVASEAECVGALDRSLPDLMILDLQLSGGAGLGRELLKRVKGRHPSLPVVILTASAAVDSAVAAVQEGAHDYLVKPVDEPRLVTAAKNAIAFHHLSSRVVSLEREVQGQGYAGLVGQSATMKTLYRQLDRVSGSDITVLIRGDSGTGKELIARAIHENGSRHNGPFIALNCAAVPDSLQESELFGHEKGSFTGATKRHVGKFEQADGGILFFDEVAELSPGLQAKLLRVLQERSFQRVGGTEYIHTDVRVVAATHRHLAKEVKAGLFREDLYYRIAVLELEVPPLRDREGDVALLATMFLEEHEGVEGNEGRSFALDALQAMVRYSWPGNVRELQNAVHRATVLAPSDVITLADLPPIVGERLGEDSVPDGQDSEAHAETTEEGRVQPIVSILPGTTMAQLERVAVEAAYGRARGNVSAAARELDISRGSLYRRLDKYGMLK